MATGDKYARLRKALEGATPGEWRALDCLPYIHAVEIGKPSPEPWEAPCVGRFDYSTADMQYVIEAQPSVVRELLAERDALAALLVEGTTHTTDEEKTMTDGQSMLFCDFRERVTDWATEREIYKHSTAEAQLLKAVSEMGELCDALIKGDIPAQEDGVGDVMVCLVNFCELAGVDIHEAMGTAWDAIKDRKGKMTPGGAFVKEED